MRRLRTISIFLKKFESPHVVYYEAKRFVKCQLVPKIQRGLQEMQTGEE